MRSLTGASVRLRRNRTCRVRFDSAWPVSFSRASSMRRGATFIWNCFTGTNRTTSRRSCSDLKKQDMSSAFRFGLAREFFQGFVNEARCNLHLELLYGDEPHHIAEVLFRSEETGHVECVSIRPGP